MFQFQLNFNIGPRLRPRHDASWEVVTTQSVEAARSPLDLDAAAPLPRRRRSTSPPSAHGAGVVDAAADDEHTRTYTFDLPARHGMPTTDDARRAVRTARDQMVSELVGSGNHTHGRASSPTTGLAPTSFPLALSLSHERWSFAIMRKDEMYRIQVAYFARVTDHPSAAASPKTPPFLEVIDSRAW